MKAKILTFDTRSELKAWFDQRGSEDRTIIYAHREKLPNNMVKYEAIVVTRQGTQRLAERATDVVIRYLERYTGTLGITTKLAEGVRLKLTNTPVLTNATGTVAAKPPSFAVKIVAHLKEYGRAKDAASINKAIGYTGPGLGSIYTVLTKQGKVVRLSRGYYIHPDHHNTDKSPSRVFPATPIQSTANNVPTAPKLVIQDTRPTVERVPKDDARANEILAWLGAMAVKMQSPEVFEITLRLQGIFLGREPIKGIFSGKDFVKEVPLLPPPTVELPRAPEIELTERQLDFGAYLEDKLDRDVTPQELVENVLKKEYLPGARHRWINDTDMRPHGWYRTREENKNVWRHESRRRVRRQVA